MENVFHSVQGGKDYENKTTQNTRGCIMAKLYEIRAEYNGLLELAEQHAEVNDGEIPDWLFEKIDALENSLEEKAISCGHIYKNNLSDADAIDVEIKRLQARKKHCENVAESMKRYLQSWIPAESKFKSPTVSIGWRKSKQVIVDDLALLPKKYIKIIEEPIKKEIKKAFESGELFSGAHIEEKQNIQIK